MKYFWNVHNREDINFTNGKGIYLHSKTAFFRTVKYLDFHSGGGVASLGYGNKPLIKALKKQASKLWFASNYYSNKKGGKVASLLCKISGFEKVFFTNSGTEGVEFAIKAARKFWHSAGEREKVEIITLNGGFHGRTFGALSAGSSVKNKEGFGKMLEGFILCEPDIIEIENKITKNTAAIMLEPIQGAEGINFFGWNFIESIKKLCEKHSVLLILDEVQTGIGRTGKIFAYNHTNIKPDIVILSKGIGGGFPCGAVLSSNKIASCVSFGSHGGTFGANPLAIAVMQSTLVQISKKSFLQNVVDSSAVLEMELQILKQKYKKVISKITGYGLMRGIYLQSGYSAKNIMQTLHKEEKMLIGVVGGDMIRLSPPLIITPKEVKIAIERLEAVLKKL